MLRLGQCVLVSDIEFIIINIVQKHIDTAEIICCDIDLLSEKALTHFIFSKYFGSFKQQRTGAASRIIDLVDLCFARRCKTCQQLGNLLRSVILTA